MIFQKKKKSFNGNSSHAMLIVVNYSDLMVIGDFSFWGLIDGALLFHFQSNVNLLVLWHARM